MLTARGTPIPTGGRYVSDPHEFGSSVVGPYGPQRSATAVLAGLGSAAERYPELERAALESTFMNESAPGSEWGQRGTAMRASEAEAQMQLAPAASQLQGRQAAQALQQRAVPEYIRGQYGLQQERERGEATLGAAELRRQGQVSAAKMSAEARLQAAMIGRLGEDGRARARAILDLMAQSGIKNLADLDEATVARLDQFLQLGR